MGIFSRLSDAFIQAFGITAPSPAQRKNATIFISVLVCGLIAVFLMAAALLIMHFLR
ncbi:MAG: hypothetical protein P4L10_06060 [Acidobacteriaceae bacterium]|jgi:hypothetical protein|nr:hypothetical protein [Acidobacteriaceae bacterium]